MKKEEVLEFFRIFCLGQENLRSGSDIARTLQISKSELRKHINRLRRKLGLAREIQTVFKVGYRLSAAG